MARQARAELAGARGNLDDAVDYYLLACDAFVMAGYDFESARCLTALANTYASRRAAGDEHKARAAVHDSQQILKRLGLN
jgi:hypothetical protein